MARSGNNTAQGDPFSSRLAEALKKTEQDGPARRQESPRVIARKDDSQASRASDPFSQRLSKLLKKTKRPWSIRRIKRSGVSQPKAPASATRDGVKKSVTPTSHGAHPPPLGKPPVADAADP